LLISNLHECQSTKVFHRGESSFPRYFRPFLLFLGEIELGVTMAPDTSRQAASDYGTCRLFAFSPRSFELKDLVAGRDLKVRFAISIQINSTLKHS
jgi:hypothetical protein